MNSPPHATIGILGVGRVGSALARQALSVGYRVVVAGSGPVSTIELIVDVVMPGAEAMTAAEVSDTADIVVASIPMSQFRSLPVAHLSGKIIIDVMNHWTAMDGPISELYTDSRTTSEVVAEFLTGARLVRTLNHIGYHEMEDDARDPGSPDRRAVVVASDDADAASLVAEFVDALGFDPVVVNDLAVGARAVEPGSMIFNGSYTARRMRDELARSKTGLPG